VEHLSHKRKMTIMFAIIVSMFFAAINQTIVGTALPRIIATLGGIDYYTWVITIFMLTSTIATVLVGKLSDIYGRKPFILSGIVFFMIGAFLSGLSKDIFQLIAFRGVQGIGAGIIMATAFTAIGDLFSPRERGRWSGIMGAVFGLSSVVGPTLGGYVVDHLAWHWVFWLFLPLGIIAFVMIWLLFPSVERKEAVSIDYLGSLFLTLTIVPMLIAFSWAGTNYAWGSPQIIGLFAFTAVSLALFLFVETRAKSPVLPLSLFRNSIVTVSNTVGFMINAGMMGAIMYMPFLTQGVLGVSPTVSGYVTMPLMVGMMITSTLTGQLMTRTGKYKNYALIGIAVMVLGTVLMHFTHSIALAVTSMIVFGFGLGPGMSVFSLTVQNAVDPKDLGVATASSQLFRNMGGTIGIAVMGTIMAAGIRSRLAEYAASGQAPDLSKVDPQTAETFREFLNPQILLDQPKLAAIQAGLPAEQHRLFDQMVGMLRDALSHSLAQVFLTGTFVMIAALALAFFLKEIPLRTSNRSPKADAEPGADGEGSHKEPAAGGAAG